MKYVIIFVALLSAVLMLQPVLMAQGDNTKVQFATPEENKIHDEMGKEEAADDLMMADEMKEADSISLNRESSSGKTVIPAEESKQAPEDVKAPVAATIPAESKPVETAPAAQTAPVVATPEATDKTYMVGVDDILDINILQPEPMPNTVVVTTNGTINFPYIGNLKVSGMTLEEVRDEVQKRLSDGYLKYPVVSVALKQGRSKRFFVYGEVMRPGAYPIDANTTALKAISVAGGFTKFGSASRVKILRPKPDGSGYQTIKVNLSKAMAGDSKSDILLQPEDMVIISEGIF